MDEAVLEAEVHVDGLQDMQLRLLRAQSKNRVIQGFIKSSKLLGSFKKRDGKQKIPGRKCGKRKGKGEKEDKKLKGKNS